MISPGTQPNIDDLLLRAMNLNKCIGDFDSDQLFLDTNLLILARENLVAEYQHTVKQLEIELERLTNSDQTLD